MIFFIINKISYKIILDLNPKKLTLEFLFPKAFSTPEERYW